MAVGLSSAAASSLLNSLTGSYTWVQLHTADPGASGTTAVATNSTRQQVTWTGSGAARENSGALTWSSVPGSEKYTHFTVWSASTAGNFGFSGTVTANSVTTGDTFTIPVGDLDISLATAA